MMAVLWHDITADTASAKRHFSAALAIYDTDFRHAAPDYKSIMAFQHAMQAGYTSFEAGLKRLFHMLDEPLPLGTDSHAVLLRRAGHPVPGSRPAVLNDALLAQADELRRFRHVAMLTYDDFDPRRATLPVDAARAFIGDIDAALERFRANIDPA